MWGYASELDTPDWLLVNRAKRERGKTMRQFILALMVTIAAGAVAKEQKINVPEGSTEATERAILALQPGEMDSTLWSGLGKYRYGDDPKLIYVLEAALSAAGRENFGRIEEELLKVVNNANATDEGRQFACRLLQRVGSEKCIPALSRLLLDEKMSHFARLAIERLPAPDAIRDALAKAPDSFKPGLIGSLGELGDAEDVPLLSKYVTDPHAAIAGSAMKALNKIGTPAALSVLKKTKPAESLKSIHRDALMAAALRNNDVSVLKDLYSNNTDINRAAALRGWLRIEEDSAVAEISRIVTSGDKGLLRDALQIITMEPSSKLTAALCSKIPTIQDQAVQVALIDALGARGDAAALKTISGLAESGDMAIANAAISALGGLNSPESIRLLLGRMKSPEHADAATRALAVITAAETNAILLSMLKERELTVQVLDALAERMVLSAGPTVVSLLNDKDEEIRKAAWSAVPDVCTASDTEVIMHRLEKFKNEQDVKRGIKSVKGLFSNVEDQEGCFNAALKFYEKGDEPVRNLILAMGSRVGSPEALEMVQSAYASGAQELKARALRALSSWSTINAAPILMDLVEHGEDEATRNQALRGYIRLADLDWKELSDDKRNFDKGMDKKYQMLLWASKRATRNSEKTSIISALGDMGHTKTMQEVELVMTYIDDPEVKADAELAALNLVKRLAKHKPAEVLPIARKLYETTESKHVKFHANKTIETCKNMHNPKESP